MVQYDVRVVVSEKDSRYFNLVVNGDVWQTFYKGAKGRLENFLNTLVGRFESNGKTYSVVWDV